MAATLTQRKAELDALLRNTDDTSKVSGVNAAYDHEPVAGFAVPPVFTTCTVAGMTPDVWQFAVRLYIALNPDPAAAQRLVETLVPAVDAAIGADSQYGPSNWSVVIAPAELGAIVATNILECGREDYY